MSQFLILKALEVTDAMLYSSTVAETDYPAWAVGTTYAVGAMVQVLSTHSVYESQVAGNVGVDPTTNPDKWVRVRATNRWRCFDKSNSSRTTQASAISYVFAPGVAVPMVAALNLVNCTSIRVRLIDPTYGTVYDKTLYPGPLPIQPDPWEWAFGEWSGGQSITLWTDLPSFRTAKLHVDLVGGPALALGLLMFGAPRAWGDAGGVDGGVRVGRQIYSTREANKYGDLTLVKRPSAKRSSFELRLRKSEVDPLLDFLDEIDADICLYVVSRGYESLVIVGIFENADVVLDRPTFSALSIELLGTI